MFRIIDISMTIHEGMQVYSNREEKQPRVVNLSSHESGPAYESKLEIHAHCGTHVDAPLHMLEDGAAIETIGLERLVGNARVLDLTHVEDGIGRSELEAHSLQRGEWVLLKTRNSLSDDCDPSFVYLKEDGARYLIETGVVGVGIDNPGIERSQPDYPTHRSLFRNNVVIVEGLRLKEVSPGTYFMVIAPLKLTGIDAAPARAFLIGSA